MGSISNLRIGESFPLVVQSAVGLGADFNTVLPESVKNDNRAFQIALLGYNIPYLYYNISASLGNNTLSYNNGSSAKSVSIADGLYSMDGLNQEFANAMALNGDYDSVQNEFYIDLYINPANGKTAVKLSNSYTLDLSNGTTSTLYNTLGWNANPTLTTTGVHYSTDVCRLSGDVCQFIIKCDLVSGSSYVNNSSGTSDLLYAITPNVSPASLITSNIATPLYIPINKTYFNSVRIQIRDQSDNALEGGLMGDRVVLFLSIRRVA